MKDNYRKYKMLKSIIKKWRTPEVALTTVNKSLQLHLIKTEKASFNSMMMIKPRNSWQQTLINLIWLMIKLVNKRYPCILARMNWIISAQVTLQRNRTNQDSLRVRETFLLLKSIRNWILQESKMMITKSIPVSDRVNTRCKLKKLIWEPTCRARCQEYSA